MGENQGADETLMDICAEAPGCFEIDPESGDPMGTCVYPKLIQLGYSSQSSVSADAKMANLRIILTDWSTRIHLENETIGKMRPERLKLASIIQKCKSTQSASAANNFVNLEENAYILSYATREIGEFERKNDETAPPAHKPNGRPWQRVAEQVGRNSLEWMRRRKFLSIWEFSAGGECWP